MSAERGWLGEPPSPTEWHTPGWVKEGGRHFITPPDARVPASSTASDRISARDRGTVPVTDGETHD